MIHFKGVFKLPDNKNIRATADEGYILLLPQLKKDRMDIDCLVYPTIESLQVFNGHIASFRINDLLYFRYVAYFSKKNSQVLNYWKLSFTEGELKQAEILVGDKPVLFSVKHGMKFENNGIEVEIKKESALPSNNNGKNVVEKTLSLAHELLMERFKKIYQNDISEKSITFEVVNI